MILHFFVDELKYEAQKALFASYGNSYNLRLGVDLMVNSVKQLNYFDIGEMIWCQIIKKSRLEKINTNLRKRLHRKCFNSQISHETSSNIKIESFKDDLFTNIPTREATALLIHIFVEMMPVETIPKQPITKN